MAHRYWPTKAALVGLFILLFAPAGLAATAPIEDSVAIRTAIEAAVMPRLEAIKGANAEIAVDAIDSRLQLPECPAVVVTLPPNNAATISAKVSCERPAWTVYVPVHVHAWVEAVVAASNLVPNRPLGAHDLTRGRVDMFASRGGLLTDPKEAEGKILRAGLPVGSPILSPLLDLPITVHRGQNVVMTLSDPSMTIKATALALEDGRVGDSISVQNPESRKTLRATVAGDGSVELKF